MAASTASEKLAPSADPSRPSSLANAPALDDNTQQEPNDLPHGARLVAILLSLILALFLVSLDNVGKAHHMARYLLTSIDYLRDCNTEDNR